MSFTGKVFYARTTVIFSLLGEVILLLSQTENFFLRLYGLTKIVKLGPRNSSTSREALIFKMLELSLIRGDLNGLNSGIKAKLSSFCALKC